MRRVIRAIPEEETLAFRDIATSLSPDPKDILYFAAALYLSAPIWSNDKRLKAQKEIPVLSTEDLLRILGAPEPSF